MAPKESFVDWLIGYVGESHGSPGLDYFVFVFAESESSLSNFRLTVSCLAVL